MMERHEPRARFKITAALESRPMPEDISIERSILSRARPLISTAEVGKQSDL